MIGVVAMIGGLGVEEGLALAVRAMLLVLVATWLRAAAGTAGLREVSRRALARLGACLRARRGGPGG